MIKRIALADFIAFALANLWIQYDAIRFSHDSVVMTAWALTFLAFPIVALAKKGKDIEKDKNINYKSSFSFSDQKIEDWDQKKDT